MQRMNSKTHLFQAFPALVALQPIADDCEWGTNCETRRVSRVHHAQLEKNGK